MPVRDRVIARLAGCSGWISGSALAEAFGLTRAAVWKHVDWLQRQGWPIESRARSGYRFQPAFDASLARAAAAGRSLGGWTLHYQFEAASTQKLALQAAQSGCPSGHLWLAERQSAGRGRLGRRWDSGLGGLWMSLLLRPRLPVSQAPAVTLMAAWCLARTLHEEAGIPAALKWPNDVLCRDRGRWKKAAGILTEMSAEVDRVHWMIMGIGLNVFNRLASELRPRAVALSDMPHRSLSRAAILTGFLGRFERALAEFERCGFPAFQRRYWKAYATPNGHVVVQTSQGALNGKVRGVDAHGSLLVESRRVVHPVSEGEIVL